MIIEPYGPVRESVGTLSPVWTQTFVASMPGSPYGVLIPAFAIPKDGQEMPSQLHCPEVSQFRADSMRRSMQNGIKC